MPGDQVRLLVKGTMNDNAADDLDEVLIEKAVANAESKVTTARSKSSAAGWSVSNRAKDTTHKHRNRHRLQHRFLTKWPWSCSTTFRNFHVCFSYSILVNFWTLGHVFVPKFRKVEFQQFMRSQKKRVIKPIVISVLSESSPAAPRISCFLENLSSNLLHYQRRSGLKISRSCVISARSIIHPPSQCCVDSPLVWINVLRMNSFSQCMSSTLKWKYNKNTLSFSSEVCLILLVNLRVKMRSEIIVWLAFSLLLMAVHSAQEVDKPGCDGASVRSYVSILQLWLE